MSLFRILGVHQSMALLTIALAVGCCGLNVVIRSPCAGGRRQRVGEGDVGLLAGADRVAARTGLCWKMAISRHILRPAYRTVMPGALPGDLGQGFNGRCRREERMPQAS